MKILVVINSLTAGGAERVISTLTGEWARDHKVLIALFDAFTSGLRLWGRDRGLG